jgi:hypothetical protein
VEEDPPDDMMDPGDPVPPSICDPGPVTRASDLAPDLYAWILAAEQGSCHLERRTSGGAIDGFTTSLDTFPAPGTVSCEADGCWTALPAFARGWSHVPAPAPFSVPTEYGGEKWTGMVQAARHADTGEIRATLTAMPYGSSAVQVFQRRFDAAGRLLEERHSFGGSPWFTTVNTWEGDHLVASRFLDTVNSTGETDYVWSYADGRLTRATVMQLDSGRSAVVDFTWEGDRLASAVRTVDGMVWARQTWTWSDDRLVQSSTEVVPELSSLVYDLSADDLEPLIAASSHLDWQASRPEPAAAGACAALPHALGYGYPVADGAYHLGWPVGDRPAGIDMDYGFGPAYDSGMERWFGHDGVEYYSFHLPWSAPSLTVVVDYDRDGRMTSETLSSSDDSVSWVRTRTLAGQRVERDRRVLEFAGQTLTTELGFAWDEAGDLVERTYVMNDKAIGLHEWSYARGQVTRHAIAEHRLTRPEWSVPLSEQLGALPADLPAPVVHERRISADGLTVEILREAELTETRRLDDAGRVLSRLYPPSSLETYAWEASGDLRSYSSDYEMDTVPDLRLSWERAEDGRLLAREWAYPHVSDRDQFSYACQ